MAAESIVGDKLGDKSITSFVEDAPKLSRYTLADAEEKSKSVMDYSVVAARPEDRERVLRFLRRFFFRDEPLNDSISLVADDESTCLELEEYSLSALMEGLSFMAVSSKGDIIGVMLNGEMVPVQETEPEYITNCRDPKFKKILKLLYHVDKSVNIPCKFPGKRVLEIRIISVDSNWRGKGVARALMESSIALGQSRDFDMIRTDCSSFYSGKLCQRFGFKPIYELKYCDYKDETGTAVFSPAMPHEAVVTYVRPA